MKEDKITNALIETFKSREESDINPHYKVEASPEVHYNYYGSRGVVDLFVRDYEIENCPPNDHVFEIKSTPKSANEVIRQFKRMEKTFYMDESRSEGDRVIFELCFTPKEENLRHVAENFEMYHSLLKNFRENGYKVNVTMRHPDDTNPVMLVHKYILDDAGLLAHAKSSNSQIYELMKKWSIPDFYKEVKA